MSIYVGTMSWQKASTRGDVVDEVMLSAQLDVVSATGSLSEHVLGPGLTDQQCGGSSIPRHKHSPASKYRENRARGVMVDARSYGIEGQWFV